LDFSNMFYLYGVCVWILPFPPAGIEIIKTDSPHVYFTTDCLSTATKPDKINSNLNIYPNPAKEYIVFDLTNNSSPAIVEIFGIQGKKMFEHKISGDNRLFISYLPKGIYLYRLYNNDNIYSGKITVE